MDTRYLTDDDLLTFLRSGDEGAFTEIYNRYWKKTLSVATLKSGGNMTDAEEIVQDIFTSLWNRRSELSITTSLEIYLAASVKYRVIKNLAKREVRRRFENQNPALFSDADYTTQNWLDFEELQDRLQTLVASLPEKCRLVYRLSREDGYSQKEIATEMGISEKTVEAHLGKALRVLRSGLNIALLVLSAMFNFLR